MPKVRPPFKKRPTIYSRVDALDAALDIALTHLDDFASEGVILEILPTKLRELRAWVHTDILEYLLPHEQKEWAKFGRRVRLWEKKMRDPNDVLREAERIKASAKK